MLTDFYNALAREGPVEHPVAVETPTAFVIPDVLVGKFVSSSDSSVLKLKFSKITFNADRTRAFVRITTSCGVNCGSIEDVYLNRSARWRVSKRVRIWDSSSS